MIVTKLFATVKCDNCKQSLYHPEFDEYWTNEEVIEEIAHDSEWLIRKYTTEELPEGIDHLCPDCYTWGDNDELVIIKRYV